MTSGRKAHIRIARRGCPKRRAIIGVKEPHNEHSQHRSKNGNSERRIKVFDRKFLLADQCIVDETADRDERYQDGTQGYSAETERFIPNQSGDYENGNDANHDSPDGVEGGPQQRTGGTWRWLRHRRHSRHERRSVEA